MQHATSSPATRHPSLVTRRLSAAFTLIELLVVIAIIAILAGLGFAAMSGAMNSGRKAAARNEVVQIATAIKNYQLEYGRLPPSEGLITALLGGESSDDNRRGITFLEAQMAKGSPPRNGLDTARENYLDSWGRAYEVLLDDGTGQDSTAYDNRIRADLGSGEQEYLTSVIVKSIGPDANGDDAPDKPSDVISNLQ